MASVVTNAASTTLVVFLFLRSSFFTISPSQSRLDSWSVVSLRIMVEHSSKTTSVTIGAFACTSSIAVKVHSCTSVYTHLIEVIRTNPWTNWCADTYAPPRFLLGGGRGFILWSLKTGGQPARKSASKAQSCRKNHLQCSTHTVPVVYCK